MQPKFYLQSKTLLLNGAVVLLLAVNFALDNQLVHVFIKDPTAEATITGFLVALLALVNLALRTRTNQGVTFTKPQ